MLGEESTPVSRREGRAGRCPAQGTGHGGRAHVDGAAGRGLVSARVFRCGRVGGVRGRCCRPPRLVFSEVLTKCCLIPGTETSETRAGLESGSEHWPLMCPTDVELERPNKQSQRRPKFKGDQWERPTFASHPHLGAGGPGRARLACRQRSEEVRGPGVGAQEAEGVAKSWAEPGRHGVLASQ